MQSRWPTLCTLSAAALAAALAGCSPRTAAVQEVDPAEVVPGLIDVELRGFTPEHKQLAASLGTVLQDTEVEEEEFDLVLPDRFSEEILVVQTDPAQVGAELAMLRARPDVIYAEPVVRVRALWEPNDPEYKKQWHLRAAGAPKAWDAVRGAGVTVAVIDTGIAPVDDLDANRLLAGWNFVSNAADARDDHGHGTHVAGTVAQATGNGLGGAGMAPEARLLPLKVLGADGSGTSAGIAQAIRYAADHGARVLNLSLGGGGRSEAMAAAVAYAWRKGCLVVCAAGNNGVRGVSYPAAYPDAFAVSATGPQGRIAPYSSFGPEIQLAGPGGDKSQGEEAGVLQETIDPATGKGVYRWFQGTSMATPHVAGAAALVYSAGVTNPDAVARLLKDNAGTPPDAGGTGLQAAARSPAELYGAGPLDAGGALRSATFSWGLMKLGLALLGAFVAIRHARSMNQLRASERVSGMFWASLAVGAGALAALAPLGLARLPVLGALALPPAGMAAHWLGLPGTSALASAAGWLGWSALPPVGLALFSRGVGRARPAEGGVTALAAGFAFGWAGLLLQAALVRSVHLPWVPQLVVPFWLGISAVISWWAGRGLLARESIR